MSERGFWSGRNVLVTGSNGFVGANLAKRLLAEGAHVVGLERNRRRNTFLYFERLDRQVALVRGDLTDAHLMNNLIAEERIEFVFHLAAQVEVGVAVQNPYATFETNVRGTYTLLEAIRLFGKSMRGVVVASTDKAYGSYDRSQMPYNESYALRARYPYDVSKACADTIARCYATELYSLPIAITRFSNIYGPGQLNYSALIPDLIRSALGYSTFEPRGSGDAVRDFLFVDDVVELYLRIGRAVATEPSGLRGEVFNAGTNVPTSVRAVVETVFNLLGKPEDLRLILEKMRRRAAAGEIDCQYMDYEKVERTFGWRPSTPLEIGLRATMDWFRAYLARHEAGVAALHDAPQAQLTALLPS